jgi:hypothetical protein
MKTIPQNDYAARIRFHAERLAKLNDVDTAMAFHHFLGAVEGMCEPKSLINPGPNRERLLLALERAVNTVSGS